MKCLAENRLAHVEATNVNSNYPVANLYDADPTMPMQLAHGVSSTNLDVDIAAGAGGLALINTNIASVTVTQLYAGSTENEADVTMEADAAYDVPAGTSVSTTVMSDTHNGNHLIAWDAIDTAIKLRLTICSCGETLSIGELAVAEVIDVDNPHYGLNEGRIDLSPPVMMADNVPWFPAVDQGRRRTWSGEVLVKRETAYYDLMDIVDKYGGRPLVWLLVGKNCGNRWIAYCTLSMPNSTHDYMAYSTINFSWREI